MNSAPDQEPKGEGRPWVTAGEMVEQCMANLRLNRDYPLVRAGKHTRNVGHAFTFLSYPHGRPGTALQYGPFYVKDMADGMQWIAHLSEKSWVTVDHLGIFSIHLLDTFAQGRR